MTGDWRIATRWPSLGADEVHVWRTNVTVAQAELRGLTASLTAEELERAAKYRSEYARREYVVTRGVSRVILGHYLTLAPGMIRFESDARGKPQVAQVHARSVVHFNVSHSGDVALVALSRRDELGVDIEELRDDTEIEAVARRLFSPSKLAEVNRMPAAERRRAVFTAWTRAEALAKAKGEGLAAISSPASDIQHGWSVCDLDAGPTHVAALAIRGSAPTIACWQWTAGLADRID
ncbi:MAG: 4'-phosphopantetheinyl transferase family protein [Candidatus Binataceae bacterium]